MTNRVSTLHELCIKLKDFLVSEYNGTTPWVFVNDNIDDEYLHYHPFGMTFKIPNGITPAFITINWEHKTPDSYGMSGNIEYFYDTKWKSDVTCVVGADEQGNPIYKTFNYEWPRNTVFKDSGEYLFFNLHLKYDEGLYSYEQGGTSTEYESYRDTPPTDAYNLIPLHERIDCACLTEDVFVTPKRFPGMGSSILSISDGNKGESNYTGIEYWMTKTDRSATVTTRVCGKYYQSVTFGFLEHVDERVYAYPLYIGGGTQALTQDVYTYTLLRGRCPSHKYGNVYSSDVKNKAFVNGNILNTCKFNGANCTNFRVRRPSGVWDNYNNFVQTASRVDYYECRCGGGGMCYEPPFIYKLNSPILDTSSTARIYPRDMGFNLHEIRTTAIEDKLSYEYNNKLDQYVLIPTDILATNMVPPIKRKMDISTPLMPILPYLSHHIENFGMKDSASANGVMGQVPGQYALWDKSDRHGEYTLNGRNYLLVPAGYAGRLISYPAVNGIVNWFPTEEMIDSWYNGVYNDNNMVYSTLAIDITIDITLDFLLTYIVLKGGNGNSFSVYNNRLYYLNNVVEGKSYYYVYDNLSEILKKELLDTNIMSIVFKDIDGYTVTVQEVDGKKFGKDNVKVVSKVKE